MVSLITDADHSVCAVAVAAADPRTGLADVNVVHSPALPLSCPLLLNPAELGGPGNIQEITLHSFNWQKRERRNKKYQRAPTLRRRGLAAGR